MEVQPPWVFFSNFQWDNGAQSFPTYTPRNFMASVFHFSPAGELGTSFSPLHLPRSRPLHFSQFILALDVFWYKCNLFCKVVSSSLLKGIKGKRWCHLRMLFNCISFCLLMLVPFRPVLTEWDAVRLQVIPLLTPTGWFSPPTPPPPWSTYWHLNTIT